MKLIKTKINVIISFESGRIELFCFQLFSSVAVFVVVVAVVAQQETWSEFLLSRLNG